MAMTIAGTAIGTIIAMTASAAAFTPLANSDSATAQKWPARTCGRASRLILARAGIIMPIVATATTWAIDTNIANTTLLHIGQVMRAFTADTGTDTTGKRFGGKPPAQAGGFCICGSLFRGERLFDCDFLPLLNFNYAVQAAVAGHRNVNYIGSRILIEIKWRSLVEHSIVYH